MKKLTKKQIEKMLIKENIDLTGLNIENEQIEIILGYEESNGFGNCDSELVECKFKEINNKLSIFNGGFYTGYGSFITRPNYKSTSEYSTWCD